MAGFKWLPTMVAIWTIRLVYGVAKTLWPVNANKITFASYRANQLKDNLAYIYEEWQKREWKGQTVFLLKRYRPGLLGKLDYFGHMVKASWHLATSRFFIIDDYYFPIYVITPRNGTEIVQLWHAAGAFKKFGHSTKDRSFGPSEAYLKRVKVHSNYSRVMVSGKEVIPFYAEAFDMPEGRIAPLGIPRTDYFFNKEKERDLCQSFSEAYPELKDKQIILYAPTFRGKSHNQDVFDCPLDLSRMKQLLSDKYVLFIHLHPYMAKGMTLPEDMTGFVYMIEGQYNIQELLTLSDLLITDYSSIIFDYSLREKPMAFFAHDLEEYEKERGFYYDYSSFIPGPLFKETETLVRWIEKGAFDIEMVKAFKNQFFDVTDGQASKRIVDYLENLKTD